MVDAHEAFGVADNEEPAGGQVVAHALYGLLARWDIKINHHIAAKNNMLLQGDWVFMLEEVDPLVAHFVTQFTPDTAFAFLSAKALLKVAFQQVWGHRFHGIHAVNTLPRRSEDTFGNI